jgi:hypothetical protein
VSAPPAEIEVVSDLDARWSEIAPLLRALHEQHEPLLGRWLLDDWEERHRRLLDAAAASGEALVLLAWVEGRAIGFANGPSVTIPP